MHINRNLFLTIGLVLIHTWVDAQSDLKLWYNKPAASWNEALPIGNGRLGAMIFGNVSDELIQLNEGTLWSGGPVNTNPNPLAPKFLAAVRAAVAAGDYRKADSLAKKMQGPFTESFEPLGDVHIRQSFANEPASYYRDLDLSTASATTRFTIDGVEYKREQFV
ncbi:MAG TPA: glycoside hydrolase family 95 protein, partial [Cyclobacteriaceae bacterium]|nr:glycoside hydrolase family 95 protein [Cyclobacteriaceae bacterium]